MNNNGEIKIKSKMGKFLYKISKNTKYNKYIETGSKNGNGSTYCILKGLLERDDNSYLIGYETNKNFYLNAINNLKNIPSSKVIIKNKTLVSYQELPSWKTWNNNKKELYSYNKDLLNCEVENFINDIDILLLDAGGWSRQAEWEKYKNNIKVIIIDDTKISTNLIREEIISDESWNILHDELKDRNGWLAAEKISS